MNWTQYSKQYSKYLDEKIADAHYNMTYTEKKYREAKAQHEAAIREKESFEKALDSLVNRREEGGV